MTKSESKDASRAAPEGWALQSHGETFSSHAGPFYFREDGAPGVGFFAEPRHANMGGIVHGGALLTLADMALFNICFSAIGQFKAVTVTLNAEFVGAGPIGAFIEASGEIVRAGRKLIFVRGIASANGDALMSFSGTLKRVD